MKLRVFLCHASEDKNAVRELYLELKRRGFSAWLDTEDLIGGQDWDEEIRKAVRSAHVVLVCLSEHSIAKTGYVQKEIRTALDAAELQPDGQIYIVPLRLCACNIPERLKRWQTIDLFQSDGLDRLERCLTTRCFIGALWRSSDDDPTILTADTNSLARLRDVLQSVSPPSAVEVFDELESSAETIRRAPDFASALQLCMALRTTLTHLTDAALVAPSTAFEPISQADEVVQRALPSLDRVTDKHAERYVRSIHTRAGLLSHLRRQFQHR